MLHVEIFKIPSYALQVLILGSMNNCPMTSILNDCLLHAKKVNYR